MGDTSTSEVKTTGKIICSAFQINNTTDSNSIVLANGNIDTTLIPNVTTLQTQMNSKLSLSGGVMTGDLDLNNKNLNNINKIVSIAGTLNIGNSNTDTYTSTNANMIIGNGNKIQNNQQVVCGVNNTINHNITDTFGTSNNINSFMSQTFGSSNTTTLTGQCNLTFGYNNTMSAVCSSGFGADITNNIAHSLVLGDNAIVQIRPNSKICDLGNSTDSFKDIYYSGNLINTTNVSQYLTTTSAASTYLPITTAASTYLPITANTTISTNTTDISTLKTDVSTLQTNVSSLISPTIPYDFFYTATKRGLSWYGSTTTPTECYTNTLSTHYTITGTKTQLAQPDPNSPGGKQQLVLTNNVCLSPSGTNGVGITTTSTGPAVVIGGGWVFSTDFGFFSDTVSGGIFSQFFFAGLVGTSSTTAPARLPLVLTTNSLSMQHNIIGIGCDADATYKLNPMKLYANGTSNGSGVVELGSNFLASKYITTSFSTSLLSYHSWYKLVMYNPYQSKNIYVKVTNCYNNSEFNYTLTLDTANTSTLPSTSLIYYPQICRVNFEAGSPSTIGTLNINKFNLFTM